jgi:hypothetical protein
LYQTSTDGITWTSRTNNLSTATEDFNDIIGL